MEALTDIVVALVLQYSYQSANVPPICTKLENNPESKYSSDLLVEMLGPQPPRVGIALSFPSEQNNGDTIISAFCLLCALGTEDAIALSTEPWIRERIYRKLIDKLTVEELPASSRKYPYIAFDMEREVGKDILQVTGLSKTVDGVKVLNNVSFTVGKGDKIAFVGNNEIAVTTLFKILMEEMEPDEGTFKWGSTTSVSYFPNDNSAFFDNCQLSIIDWMRQYSKDETESYLRGFLGRMLFSGDDVFKQVNVLSGGEKVRCMFSRMMLFQSNVLILDRPTNHLDLESITAVNNGLSEFKGNLLFASHDHEILETAANRIIEITENGCLDRHGTYDDFVAWRHENVGGKLML